MASRLKKIHSDVRMPRAPAVCAILTSLKADILGTNGYA